MTSLRERNDCFIATSVNARLDDNKLFVESQPWLLILLNDSCWARKFSVVMFRDNKQFEYVEC